MEDRYKVTYDHKQKAFTVHIPNAPLTFRRMNKLYVCVPGRDESFLNDSNRQAQSSASHVCLVETVSDNMRRFTKRQIKAAYRARELYHSLGRPSLEDFKKVIKANMIQYNLVTLEDIHVAEAIFGPDVGALKGRSTYHKSPPIVKDYIEIPKVLLQEHQRVALCMDILTVNSLTFLTTVSKKLLYRTAQHITSKQLSGFIDRLKEVVLIYNTGGFIVETIDCDNAFKSSRSQITEELHLKDMNFCLPDHHEPYSERNNRVIKERVRSLFHGLPYLTIPKQMVIYMVTESAKMLNYFPPKGGVSDTYSPRAILHQQPLDYEKHCGIPFGSYCQAADEMTPKNSQKPRTLDCIYL